MQRRCQLLEINAYLSTPTLQFLAVASHTCLAQVTVIHMVEVYYYYVHWSPTQIPLNTAVAPTGSTADITTTAATCQMHCVRRDAT